MSMRRWLEHSLLLIGIVYIAIAIMTLYEGEPVSASSYCFLCLVVGIMFIIDAYRP